MKPRIHEETQQLRLTTTDCRYGEREDVMSIKYAFGSAYIKAEEVGCCIRIDIILLNLKNDFYKTIRMIYLLNTGTDENTHFAQKMWEEEEENKSVYTNNSKRLRFVPSKIQ